MRQFVQGHGQIAQPLGIVRRGAEKLLLQSDRARDRGGGAFRVARFILQQTQIAVGQGQIGKTLPGIVGRVQDFFLEADRFRIGTPRLVGLPDALQDQGQIVLADAEPAAVVRVRGDARRPIPANSSIACLSASMASALEPISAESDPILL